jgi:hypothetical protein
MLLCSCKYLTKLIVEIKLVAEVVYPINYIDHSVSVGNTKSVRGIGQTQTLQLTSSCNSKTQVIRIAFRCHNLCIEPTPTTKVNWVTQ